MRKIPVINANEYAFDDGTIRLVSAYEQKSYISKSLKKVCLYGSSCLVYFLKNNGIGYGPSVMGRRSKSIYQLYKAKCKDEITNLKGRVYGP